MAGQSFREVLNEGTCHNYELAYKEILVDNNSGNYVAYFFEQRPPK